MSPKIFPAILMFLNLCASIVYFCHGDVRRGIYWLSALILTACVTV